MTLRHHEPRTVGEVVGRAAFALVLLAAAIIVPIAVVHATRHPGPPAQAAVVPPTVTTPATVAVSGALTSTSAVVTIRGTGFASGVKATSLAYDMAVTSTSRASSTTIQLHLTLHPGAALGPRRVALTNLDGGSVTCACVTVTFPYQTATAATKPNIVVINTDDQRWDSLGQMSATNGRTDWARFPNAFVHEPECCPSRATLFTGQYVWRHGVSTLIDGERLATGTTIATLLHGAGYQTALAGKYLNGYPFGATPSTPPGWDDFRAFLGSNPAAPQDSTGTAVGYPYVNYTTVENGATVRYAAGAADYSTDRYAADIRSFLRKADPNRPVFTYLAPVAPHFPVRPADRHATACASTPLPDPPTLNGHDLRSEPSWMADVHQVDPASMRSKRLATCRALQSVDEAVTSLFAELKASGRLANTYIVYTSDNSYSFGEHRLTGKGHLYDESTHVPLLIRGPGVVPGTHTRLTSNVDLAPTLAQVGGAKAPDGFFSGASFVTDLKSATPVPGPSSILLVGCRTQAGPASNCGGDRDFMGMAWGLRSKAYLYVVYAQTGETQLFDLVKDPNETTNVTADPAYATAKAALAQELATRTAGLGTLRGRVTDAATGKPVAGIIVHLEREDGVFVREVATDANGRYAFMPLRLVGYKIRFEDAKTTLKWYGPAGSRDTATVVHAVSGTRTLDVALDRTA